PAYLLPHLLRRIRADHHLDLPRAALLRLILNRSNPKVECPPMLNPDGPVPYQCGRLFAVFEAMQRQAIDNLNTTIADKFLGAASITPRPILLTLRRTAQGHLKKLRRKKPGAAIALEARFQEITDRLDDYPATLQLADQAQFFLGYDHQRAYDAAARAAKAATNDSCPPHRKAEFPCLSPRISTLLASRISCSSSTCATATPTATPTPAACPASTTRPVTAWSPMSPSSGRSATP